MSRVSELVKNAIRRDLEYLKSGETRSVFPHSGRVSIVASRLDDLLIISGGCDGEGRIIYKGSSIDEATDQIEITVARHCG